MASRKKTVSKKFVIWDDNENGLLDNYTYSIAKDAEGWARDIANDCGEHCSLTVYELVPVARIAKEVTVIKENL